MRIIWHRWAPSLLAVLALIVAVAAKPVDAGASSLQSAKKRTPKASSKPPQRNRRARLTYSLYQGVLTGTAGGRSIEMKAYSGGGGGSTRSASDPFAVNNPVVTEQKQRGRTVRGGPIPVGEYIILPPATWHGSLAAVLVPRASMKRSGFMIHGRGPLGSDGCIVPTDNTQFRELMERLKQDGGGVLTVVDESPQRTFR